MKFFIASFLCLFVMLAAVNSQENPKIDVDSIIANSQEEGADFIHDRLSEGKKFYRSKYYEGSFKAFLNIYNLTSQSAALNYKLGVSALLGGKPTESAGFLLESLPGVADDYYLQLGYAYQARQEYDKALDAFKNYNKTLSRWARKEFLPSYNQLVSECEFGARNARDSVPAFVINLGPTVNSYYDEYGAIENSRRNRIFYTSRRPDRLPDVPGGRDEFDERVMEASYVKNEAAEGVEVPRLNNRYHNGVAGISQNEDFLFVYHGKKRGGQILIADITGKRIPRPDRISSRIDHKIFKETSFTETSDGRVFFVSDKRNGKGRKDIWTAQRRGHGRFFRPENLKSVINTPFDEEAVLVSFDGNTLYFASNGHPGFGGFDIYKSTRNRDGEWMTPVNMGQPFNSPQDDLFFFPTSDSLVALISSSRPEGYGGLDLYEIRNDPRIPFSIAGVVADKETGDPLYAKVSVVDTLKKNQIIAAYTDSISGEYFIALKDIGNYALQAGAEGYKMKMAGVAAPRKRNAAVNLDFDLNKLKHPYTLKGAITDVDTREPVQAEIVFKPLNKDVVAHRTFSDKHSGSYSITFEDKFNLNMSVSANNYYTFSEDLLLKNKVGTMEEKNIKLEKSVIAYTLSGKVVEEKTNKPVPAELALFKPEENNAFKVLYADSVSGKYSLTVYHPGPFLLEVNGDGYFFNNMPLQFHPDTTLKVKNIVMQPMSKGASIVAENILFTTGKATLRAESYPELNRLARLLHQNTSVKIEVSGHTDNTGSASLNKKLSRARALSVKRYLESQGIEENRIEYEGYGFDRPIAPNTTSDGRAQNRRVEIEVIE
jgi:outer membrane protein OmpA-like peptidoglycan-associated protein